MLYVVVYRPHNTLNLDTRYIGPFADHDAAYNHLCGLPALGIHKAPEPGQTLHNSGVKFIQELEAPATTARITERAEQRADYAVQWGDDPPEQWQALDHEPTDADLDRLCKARGLWAPGNDYPDFTVWLNGADVMAGGGPNSGPMEEADDPLGDWHGRNL